MNFQEVVEDAIVNRQICSAQTFFQSRKAVQTVGWKASKCSNIPALISACLLTYKRENVNYEHLNFVKLFRETEIPVGEGIKGKSLMRTVQQ